MSGKKYKKFNIWVIWGIVFLIGAFSRSGQTQYSVDVFVNWLLVILGFSFWFIGFKKYKGSNNV